MKFRRELKDIFFAKLRKTNVKIIAKNRKRRKKILLEKHENKRFLKMLSRFKVKAPKRLRTHKKIKRGGA